MAIRFKTIKVYGNITTSQGGLESWDEEVPIRDWQLSPETIFVRWAENTPVPTSQLSTIIFPELWELPEYKQRIKNKEILKFRYKIEIEKPLDVVELKSDYDFNDFFVQEGTVSFRVFFKNFHLLTSTDTKIKITAKVIGTINAVGGVYEDTLEERTQIINIQKVATADVTSPYITTDKNEYNITYIKNTDTLIGDIWMKVLVHNYPEKLTRQSFFLYAEVEGNNPPIFSDYDLIVPSFEVELKRHQEFINLLPIGKHILKTPIFFNATRRNVDKASDAFIYETSVTIALTIKEKQEGFDIDKKHFENTLLLHENKQATGRFTIQNPNNLTFTFEKSDWITISQSGNEVSFTTLSAQELKAGKKQGFIKITSGNYQRVVSVVVVVEKTIDDSLDNLNFCLDEKKIIIRKQNPNAEFLKAHFMMVFFGYGKEEHLIEQTYEYVFFNNEVKLYPGEEVQDFFSEIGALEQLQINENAVVSPKNLFKACKTDITISEYDSTGTIYKTEKLATSYFLPGRKPKAYPYLTNGVLRRTFTDSLICVSALQDEFIGRKLGEIAGNSVDTTSINIPKMVVNMTFRRFVADKTFGERNIIKKEPLEFIPITNPTDVIDVLFQNQNFCPDWFSFSGEWEQHDDITHTLAENIQNGKDFKAHTEKKTTIKLNTGWLLEEEIPLLTELILSPLCFIRLGNIGRLGGIDNEKKWIRAIPISKKSLVYDNLQNVRSFIVEFQISN